MTAPLEFILNNKIYINNMFGGENENTFTKKCDLIKDKFGVPNGYYCKINYNEKSLYNKDKENPNEDIIYKEIDDELYDKLIDYANEIKTKNKQTKKNKQIKKNKKTKKIKK